MKSYQQEQPAFDLTNLTIPDAEELIEDALESLGSSTDPGLARALRFLTPHGYQVMVELCSENGRSKRRHESASTWSPEEDEIRIYFERIDGVEADEVEEPRPRAVAAGQSGRVAMPRPRLAQRAQPAHPVEHTMGEALPADIDDRVKDLCQGLAEAERVGHAFIALKWFRDSFLTRKSYGWNQTPESRQTALAEAIQRGMVLTSKIPNPKTPAYPTTTIRLNRAEAGVAEEMQRFRPVAIDGEDLNATLGESGDGE